MTTSFEQTCKNFGLDPETVIPDFSNYPEKHRKAAISTAKAYLVAEDINEHWEPDWNNRDEEKWIAIMDMEVDKNNPSGFRFHYSTYGRTYTASTGGSRLCFRNERSLKHFVKHFLPLLRDMMVIEKK